MVKRISSGDFSVSCPVALAKYGLGLDWSGVVALPNTDSRTFGLWIPKMQKAQPWAGLSARTTTEFLAPRPGLEPGTYGLTVRTSTVLIGIDWR